MDRREFLKASFGASLGALTFGALDFSGAWKPGASLVSELPNVVIILSDDQPYYSMSEMPKTQTALGVGLKFDNAYVACPTCSPSRSALMTGSYPSNNELEINDHAAKRFRNLGNHRKSIGYYLSGAGYSCGLFGKWLNGYEEIPAFMGPGYERWVCSLTDPNPIVRNSDGRLGRTSVLQRDEPSYLASKAAEWIGQKRAAGEPFFAFLSLHSPHVPANASLTYRGTYANVQRTLPPNFDHNDPNKPDYLKRGPLTTQEKNEDLAAWRGMMEELKDVDDAVQTVTNAIDFATTYCFYMTDNGFLLGEHRLERKAEPYEEAVRTPLYVRGPAVVENATSDALVSLVDIAPTLYELAGLDDLAYSCDGRSLLGHMVGASDMEWRDALLIEMPRDSVGSATTTYPGWRAIRTQDRVYVGRQSGFQELYDMVSDPYQLSNIAPSADPVELHTLGEQMSTLAGSSSETLRTAETV